MLTEAVAAVEAELPGVAVQHQLTRSRQVVSLGEEEEEEEEETLFDPKSTNVQITIPHISDIQFKQFCTHIYRHYVHKHSS